MAITVETIKGTLKKPQTHDHTKIIMKRTAGPSSYSTGGFDFTIGELGTIKNGLVHATGGYIAEIDWANSSGNTLKIKAYSGAGTEVSGGTDLSSVYFTVIVAGY